MTTIDNAAIVWSIITVISAVGLAAVLNFPANVPDANNQTYNDYNTGSPSFKIETDKTEYAKNDTIIISGTVDETLDDYPVVIQVTDSEGNLVTIAQINVGSDMKFSHKIVTGGSLWKNNEYTVKALYGGKNPAETSFRLILPQAPNLSDVFSVSAGNHVFSVGYGITNAAIRDMMIDSDCVCLIVFLDAQNDGMLIVDLPRDLINPKTSNGGDDSFFVLLDGIEIPYDEISSDPQSRMIRMEFAKNTSEIEIIGTIPI